MKTAVQYLYTLLEIHYLDIYNTHRYFFYYTSTNTKTRQKDKDYEVMMPDECFTNERELGM